MISVYIEPKPYEDIYGHPFDFHREPITFYYDSAISCGDSATSCCDQIAQQYYRSLYKHQPKVERVIINRPATIVFWDDGEKTVVKCHECSDGKCLFDKNYDPIDDYQDIERIERDENGNDVIIGSVNKFDRAIRCGMRFEEEKGIMAAMLKRLYHNFQDVIRKYEEGQNG